MFCTNELSFSVSQCPGQTGAFQYEFTSMHRHASSRLAEYDFRVGSYAICQRNLPLFGGPVLHPYYSTDLALIVIELRCVDAIKYEIVAEFRAAPQPVGLIVWNTSRAVAAPRAAAHGLRARGDTI